MKGHNQIFTLKFLDFMFNPSSNHLSTSIHLFLSDNEFKSFKVNTHKVT